jgi:hypothetical protein
MNTDMIRPWRFHLNINTTEYEYEYEWIGYNIRLAYSNIANLKFELQRNVRHTHGRLNNRPKPGLARRAQA